MRAVKPSWNESVAVAVAVAIEMRIAFGINPMPMCSSRYDTNAMKSAQNNSDAVAVYERNEKRPE